MFAKDRNHRLVYVNKSFCEFLGYEESFLLGKSDYDLFPYEEASVFRHMDELVFASDTPIVNEELNTGSNGVTRTVRTTKNAFTLENGERFLVGVVSDISELRNMQADLEKAVESLSQLAKHDRLTGLPNRSMFEALLDSEMQLSNLHSKKFAVLFIDLNGFKTVNDTAGHATGDELLKIMSERIRRTLREREVVARIGGDEFVVLIPDVSDRSVDSIASRIETVCRTPVEIDNATWKVSCSVGVSIYPDHSKSKVGIMRCADQAMYFAKENKNSISSCVQIFDNSIAKHYEKKTIIEHQLSSSHWIENFFDVYQPIVTMDQNGSPQVVGFESLARWKIGDEHVSPDEFIPALEKSDRIVELGLQTASNACHFAATHCQSSQFVSINLSGRQIADGQYLENLEQMMSKFDIRPNQIAVEFTERDAFIGQTHKHFFDKLKKLGVKIMIDDFGDGFSNLSRLSEIPADIVKIDKAILWNSLRLLKPAITMLSQLGFVTLVEGIETKKQASQATEAGATFLQGYYFGKPERYQFASSGYEYLNVATTCSPFLAEQNS